MPVSPRMHNMERREGKEEEEAPYRAGRKDTLHRTHFISPFLSLSRLSCLVFSWNGPLSRVE